MRIKSLLGALAAGLLSVTLAAAQEVAPAEVGIPVGTHAPAFKLKDQNGKEVSLEGLLKKGPVAVVFYRSADWCMFCKFELVHLQRNLKEFEAAGAQVVGVSYDPPRVLKAFAQSKAITFPLLSDPESKTIDAYSVRYKGETGSKDGFATHASFVIDQNGVVRARLLDVIYQEQPGVGFLLKALQEARSPGGNTTKKIPEKHEASSNDGEHRTPKS